MAGYATSIVNNGQAIGLDVSNALGTIRDPSPVDLYTKYPQSSGPDRTVNAVPQSLPVIRGAGFPLFTYPTNSPNWQAIGDVAVLFAGIQAGTDRITSISSANTTGWTQASLFPSPGGDNISFEIWIGQVTATGPDTVTVNWSPGTGSQYILDEFGIGYGMATTATVVANGGFRKASGTVLTGPSLVAGPPTPVQIYWCALYSGVSWTGNTPGYTYSSGGIFNVAYQTRLIAGQTYQPSGTDGNTGPSYSIGVILSLGGSTLTSATEYAGAASGLSGGVGSWVNPTNADGAPDGLLATWTAP